MRLKPQKAGRNFRPAIRFCPGFFHHPFFWTLLILLVHHNLGKDVILYMLKLFKREPSYSGPVNFMVVGLGNPGREYENSRHNAGFYTIDRIAEHCGVEIKRLKFKGTTAECTLGGRHTLLLKPSTFMNLSGQSVTEAMRFYKLTPEQVLVIFDDISLEPGKLRIRRKGSHGGQNGMKNIIYLSGSDQFPRIKMGIGQKPHPDYNLADWVLSHFSSQEQKLLDDAAGCAVKAAELIAQNQIDEAMSRFNS